MQKGCNYTLLLASCHDCFLTLKLRMSGRKEFERALKRDPNKRWKPDEAAQLLMDLDGGSTSEESEAEDAGPQNDRSEMSELAVLEPNDSAWEIDVVGSDNESRTFHTLEDMEIAPLPEVSAPGPYQMESQSPGPSCSFFSPQSPSPRVIVEPAYGWPAPTSGDATDSDKPPMLRPEQDIPQMQIGCEVSISSSETPKKGQRKRKQIKTPQNWKRSKRKLAYNAGFEYTEQARAYMKSRVLQPAQCSATKDKKACKFLCTNHFSVQDRQTLLDSFWNLGSSERRWNSISALVNKQVPARRTGVLGSNSRRKATLIYHLRKRDGEIVRVCKDFFLRTLCISEKMVFTALEKQDDCGNVPTACDQRGKHGMQAFRENIPTIEAKNTVRQHIKSFPVVESHYCRSQVAGSRRYLEATLSLAKMCDLYCEKASAEGFSPVKRSMYCHIFNTEFNLGFHRPKKDQCAFCEQYRNSGPDEKEKIQQKYALHMDMKEVCQAEKRVDKVRAKTDPSFASMNFDLQKVLCAPFGPSSLLYYSRKLAVYNLTVFNVETKHGLCNVWNETQAGRGSNEIATAIWLWIKALPETVTECSIFSDTCGGQNQNQNVASMLLSAVHLIDHLQVIDQKFLESGHTYMECDSMHSAIERRLRHEKVMVPKDYCEIMATARRKNPYEVSEWSGSEVIDWKNLCSSLLKNTKILESKQRLNWLKIKHLRVMKDYPHQIFFKYDFRDEEFMVLKIQRTRGRMVTDDSLSELVLKRAYNGPLPISPAKLKDLLALCHKNTISPEYHFYYENLNSSASATDALEVEDEDEIEY